MVRKSIWLFALAAFFIMSCHQHDQAQSRDNAHLEFAPGNDALQLPPGFQVVMVAQHIGAARHIVVRGNGDIYIALNARHNGGCIAAVHINPRTGKSDEIKYFGELGRGTGMGIHNGYLYYGSDTAIVRYKLRPGALLPDLHAELIASLPVQHEHEAKSITFDNEGHIYVNVGAPSNACQVQDRVKGSPGQNPCPLLPFHAGIWRFSADKMHQTQQNGGFRYVTGIRNCVALRWNPVAHRLYALMMGRDQLYQFYPQYYSEEQGAELPAEEFLLLREGANYGWPFVYYDQFKKALMISPEYGGNGKKAAPKGKYQDPILAFPGHWAPEDLLFYTGRQFPSKYRDGAFIAFHGSWNRAPLPQKGFNIVYVPFRGDLPSGKYEVFAGNFSGKKVVESPGDARYRPSGLAQGPDGSLYVTDDTNGTVFRIVYTGK